MEICNEQVYKLLFNSWSILQLISAVQHHFQFIWNKRSLNNLMISREILKSIQKSPTFDTSLAHNNSLTIITSLSSISFSLPLSGFCCLHTWLSCEISTVTSWGFFADNFNLIAVEFNTFTSINCTLRSVKFSSLNSWSAKVTSQSVTVQQESLKIKIISHYLAFKLFTFAI